jgi:hypothetical protein
MIVGETLAGIFLLGSFFASFFTGNQTGSETCTTSFQNIKYKNRVKRAEVVTRVNRLGPSANDDAMLGKATRFLSRKATKTLRKSKTKRGGMGNNLKCLLSFIRSAFIDYDVEFDGVVINDLNDNDILIILDNFLANHKEELVDIVKNKLHGSISVEKIMYKINSIQNNISKKINGSPKSNL